ncbi:MULTISPECIES: lysophospholipid transporter LplT [Morganella]|jgi:LPLT family lysophospholipid transporter-like MFS transporter|uniref:lysophospholipid transporter LplT n=1 Tax=Morganella TaxID=581 RepID=UPI001A1A5AEC|nr:MULTISPECIES: lysophospholipid transporter LplT [Morganella]ELA9088708.1 lysophospholipid transporter LplT [Morganella morganii]MCU6212201.1 lysophospholipid transporter LplT [Morganella morganii]MCU6236183.1 lysophospholipid transporter LplT [Morganella morganii]MCU6274526.1 lysophospholipid transporter LplT [Morganella morganii]MDH0355797.1 lysophospholipid transporter LplT [Morganella sp. GD04133]
MTAPAPLLNKGMKAVLVSQFITAFADNAILFAILAQLSARHYPEWSQPMLQMVFVLSFIVLAPFVGQIADSFPKGRVMLLSNGCKLIGAMVICVGTDPFLGYGLIGVGAAAYSPAKYGILGELTTGEQLVKANGLIEASTIVAILLGSVTGGFLSDYHITMTLILCTVMYALAALTNIYIPRLPPAKTGLSRNPRTMVVTFLRAAVSLWKNQESRFSLTGTSLFWGAGVTLRLMLVLWVPAALGITSQTMPPLLNAMVAIGIVAGAGLAARFITLETVRRCMPAGILIGGMVIIFAVQTSVVPAGITLILVGVFGGLFLVPLNAMLQKRGKETVGAGNAIAVQNLGENSAMLLMLGLYSLAVKAGVPVVVIGAAFGSLFALAIGGLWLWDIRRKKQIS